MVPPADSGRYPIAGDAVVGAHVSPLHVSQLQRLTSVTVHHWKQTIN